MGSSKGFFLKDILNFGAHEDSRGLEVSEYAKGNSEVPEKTVISSALDFDFSGFDFVVGLRFLPCLTTEEAGVIASKVLVPSFFTIDDQNSPADWYNVMSLEDWSSLPFTEKTCLESQITRERIWLNS